MDELADRRIQALYIHSLCSLNHYYLDESNAQFVENMFQWLLGMGASQSPTRGLIWGLRLKYQVLKHRCFLLLQGASGCRTSFHRYLPHYSLARASPLGHYYQTDETVWEKVSYFLTRGSLKSMEGYTGSLEALAEEYDHKENQEMVNVSCHLEYIQKSLSLAHSNGALHNAEWLNQSMDFIILPTSQGCQGFTELQFLKLMYHHNN